MILSSSLLKRGRLATFCLIAGVALASGLIFLVLAASTGKKYFASALVSAEVSPGFDSYWDWEVGSQEKRQSNRLLGKIGDTNAAQRREISLAVFRSRWLAERFIANNDLLPVLFPDRWDERRKKWLSGSDGVPTLTQGAEYFTRRVRSVTVDYPSALIRISVRWKDPHVAADWVGGMIKLANDELRTRSLAESSARLEFANAELERAPAIELRSAIADVIRNETERMELARGNPEFAWKTVAQAHAPDAAYSPDPVLWACMGTLLGLLVAVVGVTLGSGLLFAGPPVCPRDTRPPGYSFATEPLLRPSTLAMAGFALSTLAWLCPDLGATKRGYVEAAVPTIASVLLLADWWLLIYVCLRIGEIAGGRARIRLPFLESVDRVDSRRPFMVFTVLAMIGVILTYVKILSTLSIAGAIAYVASANGNQLKEALYEQYSAGVLSLRYLVVFSASLAIYRMMCVRRWDWLYAVNLLLLAATALLSSRLIFVATLLAAVFLVLSKSEWFALRPGRLVTALFLGFGVFSVLSLLNASRNANYYKQDDIHFWGAGLSSIVSYLSAPLQTTMGTASHMMDFAGSAGDLYRRYVDIDVTLNTNSSFVHNIERFGLLAWPGIALLSLAAGFGFAVLRRYGRSMLLLPCAAILYASSELWRLDLFRQGIFLTWLTGGVLVAVFLGVFSRTRAER